MLVYNKRSNSCQICSDIFQANWLLSKHMKSHADPKAYSLYAHIGFTIFTCDMCKKIFARKIT